MKRRDAMCKKDSDKRRVEKIRADFGIEYDKYTDEEILAGTRPGDHPSLHTKEFKAESKRFYDKSAVEFVSKMEELLLKESGISADEWHSKVMEEVDLFASDNERGDDVNV